MATKAKSSGKAPAKAARASATVRFPKMVNKTIEYKFDKDHIISIKISIGSTTPIIKQPTPRPPPKFEARRVKKG